MHTKTLQERYKQVYQNFFAQHKIIYSAPFVMSWTGDINNTHNGLTIKQKTTLRMYIGINSDPKPGIHFGNIIYRDISESKYLEHSITEYAPYFNDLLEYIKKSKISTGGGFRISILSDLPRGVGLGFDSIFCLLLSISIYRSQGGVIFSDIENNNIREDINNPDHILYKITRYADLLESQIKGYNYISGNVPTALCPGKFPIVNFTEDIQNSGKKELLSNYDYKYFVCPVHELFPDITSIPYSPIDYGVIYSGRPTLTEHTSADTQKQDHDSIITFIDNTFKPHISGISANRKPRFHKEIIKNYTNNNENTIGSLLGYNSFEILHTLKNVFEKGFSEEDIKKLLLAVTKARHAHNALKRTSSHLTSLITCLQQYFGHRNDLLGISYNDSNIMGGSLFFVTPIEGLRKNILNTIHQTQLNFPGTDLLYANWLDGIEEKGLICEQDIAQNKTSQYTDNNLSVLVLPNKNFIFGAYEQLIQKPEVDIVLDTIHGKIYINGQKLTSKDLHSQVGTIEVLLTALENQGVDIPNKELPSSSYARSKNEMVGKIILPLIKLAKETLQKDLPLECYGAMYDYFIRLNKNDIVFGVLKKSLELEPVKS